jgi:hypothetical protein
MSQTTADENESPLVTFDDDVATSDGESQDESTAVDEPGSEIDETTAGPVDSETEPDYIAYAMNLLNERRDNYDYSDCSSSDDSDSSDDESNGDESSDDELDEEVESDIDNDVDDDDDENDKPVKVVKKRAPKSKDAPVVPRKRKAKDPAASDAPSGKKRAGANLEAKKLAVDSGCMKSFLRIAKFIAPVGFCVIMVRNRESTWDAEFFQMKKGLTNNRVKYGVPTIWASDSLGANDVDIYVKTESLNHFPEDYDADTEFENPFACISASGCKLIRSEIKNICQKSLDGAFDVVLVISGTKDNVTATNKITPRIIAGRTGAVEYSLFDEMLDSESLTFSVNGLWNS